MWSLAHNVPDESHLDTQYFIDIHKYNCPFCNRRHVSYTIVLRFVFDWTDSKPCYVYVVRCDSCGKKSMHLSYQEIPTYHLAQGRMRFSEEVTDIDDKLFYSVPT